MADVKINLVQSGFKETATAIESINAKLMRTVNLAKRSQVALSKMSTASKGKATSAKISGERSATAVAAQESRKREAIAKRETNRQIREYERAARARKRANKGAGTVGNMARGAAAGAIGIGAAAGAATLGLVVSEAKKAMKFDEDVTKLRLHGRKEGTDEVSNDQIKRGLRAVPDSFDKEDKLTALNTLVGFSGDIRAELENLKVVSKVAKATGSELNDVANMAGELGQKLEIKSPEELEKVLAQLAIAGKHGIMPMKDVTDQIVKVSASLKKSGIEADIGTISGMIQLSRKYAESDEDAGKMAEKAIDGIKKNEKKLNKKGVVTKDKSVGEIITDMMIKTNGNLSTVMSAKDAKNYSPYVDKYNELKGKGLDGKQIEEELNKIFNSFEDAEKAISQINNDAAEMNNTASSGWVSAMNKARDKLDEIDWQPIIDAIPHVVKAFELLMVELANFMQFLGLVTGSAQEKALKESKAKYVESGSRLDEIRDDIRLKRAEKKDTTEEEKKLREAEQQHNLNMNDYQQKLSDSAEFEKSRLHPSETTISNFDKEFDRVQNEKHTGSLTAPKEKPKEEIDVTKANDKINEGGNTLGNALSAIAAKLQKKMDGTTE